MCNSDSQERLDVHASGSDLSHHVVPAPGIGTRSGTSARPVAGCPCPSRATTHTPRAPPLAPTPRTSVQLAQTLGGDWGVVGAWRGLVGKGLLEALLSDQGPGAGC